MNDAQESLEQLQMEGLNTRGGTALFRDYTRRTTQTLCVLKL
jgi:hypothetical protein